MLATLGCFDLKSESSDDDDDDDDDEEEGYDYDQDNNGPNWGDSGGWGTTTGSDDDDWAPGVDSCTYDSNTCAEFDGWSGSTL